ncbi:ATP-dependent Clp protease ATP-binding subunit [Pseudonocardia sp. KRD-184]|uniref:ATP-dependent Clp protease ATP-binding subunit n=2 Tax=Pseudonocardia oceani TaxID=2792013 RepID=A0ABS6UJP2_9PSEU|nr:ATP-dependent Clp protease ATP-binding subunit [Pseudonocardia oceani]MBW0098423.1 ATP-dependent Clp protease ATP-binding subunit [Pseudonocardia oceani]MBW0112152.1 ATP-dependent Clp protease ATP-binding subunit [Pseudonocardia oceani]MBW0120805.1 ATP-dependent Clp protease ATP-binding subunit [Pseudonocardia oceani]MBW0132444.1 ATP-dependent Clp protease ATP-binding subunit [Pseudonocardia oceani]
MSQPFGGGLGPLEGLVGGLLRSLEEQLSDGLRDDRSEGERSPFGVPREDAPRTGTTERPRARTPQLDRHGRDLTDAARRGLLDPVIGREDEVDQVLEVLGRRTKNNPVLVGDPGVGKTAIVEGIAQRVADGEVPPALRGVRVVSLDLAGMVAGTRYRGDFEQRVTAVVNEVVAARRSVVLFVDEVHAVVGAGSAEGGALDAATILKPALARGELQLIGATTAEDHRRHIARDAALERRFEPVHVAEPTPAQTLEILRGLRARYERHHGVTITDGALEAAVRLSARYVPDRFQPDKSIDLVDRSAARLSLRGLTDGDGGTARELTADAIADAVARSTGIPSARLRDGEAAELLDLDERLARRVVGQAEAVAAVADAVRRSRAGLASPERPVGSFLFLGPTGVGKTELARALAEALFGTEERMVRLDMSEYGDRSGLTRLLGAPPGHIGYDDAGQLTEALRRHPYTVLLFDEVEKAHPDVLAVLLQLLDAGRLTDSHGRVADASHAVVVLTSNLGAATLLSGRAVDDVREEVLAEARLRLAPELVGRVDEVVPFAALTPADLARITGLLLGATRDRLAEQGLELAVSDAAVAWLAARGHRPEHGARPLRRTIARELDRPLARLLLAGRVPPGSTVRVDAPDDDGTALLLTTD